MTGLGVALGSSAVLIVGICTGMNAKRPWTHVPWRTMLDEPDSFGGRAAVRAHFGHIVGWSVGLIAYSQAVVASATFGLAPALAEIYPVLNQRRTPYVGLATEIVTAIGAAIVAW